MYFKTILFLATTIFSINCYGQKIYLSAISFRIDPGERTCIFETGKAGQMLETYFQVLDGQHGDLDISFEAIDPNQVTLVRYFKHAENSVILNLEVDGDYAFCMDNTYSVLNSKLVFMYILLEDNDSTSEIKPGIEDAGGDEETVLRWEGIDENGQTYTVKVAAIADSISATLGHVVKSRRLLNIYAASKSRDSYMAFEDTFIVDMWSSFQITLMFLVGMLQVYMIKKLFNISEFGYESIYRMYY